MYSFVLITTKQFKFVNNNDNNEVYSINNMSLPLV